MVNISASSVQTLEGISLLKTDYLSLQCFPTEDIAFKHLQEIIPLMIL